MRVPPVWGVIPDWQQRAVNAGQTVEHFWVGYATLCAGVAAVAERARAITWIRVRMAQDGLSVGGPHGIDHSMRFRDGDQMLIPAKEWERDRAKYLGLSGLPATADTFVEQRLATG
ncbi:hypothetical protein [Cupriavidus sp. PET2-C1]